MIRSLAATLVLVLAAASFAQDTPPSFPEPAPPSPFDQVVTVEPGQPFTYTADFSGTLFVWPAWQPGDPPLVLALDDATDDGDGGVRTPCMKRDVEPDATLSIAVTGANGPVALHLVAAPETDATREAAAESQDELAAIATLRDAGDLDEARARITAHVDALLAVEGAVHSERISDACGLAGQESRNVSLSRTTFRAWTTTLQHRLRVLPDDEPALATARQGVAGMLIQLGDPHGARALLEQVLAVRSRTLPDDDPDLAWARQNLASTLSILGDLHGARILHEQVLAAYSRTLPEDHHDLARARWGLATTLHTLGDLEGARALQEQVLAVFSRTLPEDDADLAAARSNLAMTLKVLGDLQGARALEEQVLAMFSRTLPEDHPNLLMARMNLAATLKALGHLHDARVLEEQVVALRSRLFPEDHPELATARSNLAITLTQLGDLHGARALEEQVLAAFSRTLREDHPHLAAARLNLAATLASLGDLQGARSLFEQALALLSRSLPEDDPDLAAARLNLGITLNELGDLHGARALQEQVLATYLRRMPEDHPAVATARSNLALTLNDLGDPHGARALEEQVVAVLSRTVPDDHPALARAQMNLAHTLGVLGDLQGARALGEQVHAVRSRLLPDDHVDLAVARMNLAVTLARQRAQAEGGDAGAADGRRFAELSRAYAGAVGRRARSVWVEGGTREVEERLASAAGEIGQALSLADGFGVFEPDADSQAAGFVASECMRGAALVASAVLRVARHHPNYATARSALANARAEASRAGQGGVGEEFERALQVREAAERDVLAIAIESGAAEVITQVPEVGGFAATLGADESAVAFRRYVRQTVDANGWRSTDAICAFVLASDGALQRIELGPAAPIEDAIEELRRSGGDASVRGHAAVAQRSSAGPDVVATLGRLVLEPLRAALGDAKRVVLVPDDVLHLVPFDALPWGDRRFGDAYAIEVRSTLFERMLGDERSREGSLVAVGDVDFGAAKDAVGALTLLRGGAFESFGALPATGPEARGIADGFDGERVVVEGGDATRDALAALAPKARFLHLATHGWFAPESIRSMADPPVIDAKLGLVAQSFEERVAGSSPMILCGLALAGANLPVDERGRYPGLITAEEIAGWDLANCELAVLSACDTNVGLRRAGQGVASLQKALHIAGARSVITSLWKVGDESTKDLMLDFYRRLWVEKKPKHQALWEAKMRIRDMKDESGAPKYTTRDWAAWVLTGDPE